MQRCFETMGRLLRRGYPLVFAFVFWGYIALSALPPVLMHAGADLPAKAIYSVYQHFCHQLPYRCFFLYGEQPYYPLERAGISGVKSYESLGVHGNPRSFIGDETLGWKMAVCERDVALWTTMGLVCLIFFISRNALPRISLRLTLLGGILPMALDGGTQMLSRILSIPRESTPLLRVLTGAAFGCFTLLFLLPTLEDSIRQGEPDDRE